MVEMSVVVSPVKREKERGSKEWSNTADKTVEMKINAKSPIKA
jgi:hypothetical protein